MFFKTLFVKNVTKECFTMDTMLLATLAIVAVFSLPAPSRAADLPALKMLSTPT